MSQKLKAWRKANGVTAEALAAKVNRLPRQVYRWEDGTSIPEPPIMALLAEITGGEVQPNDFCLLNAHEPPTQREGAV